MSVPVIEEFAPGQSQSRLTPAPRSRHKPSPLTLNADQLDRHALIQACVICHGSVTERTQSPEGNRANTHQLVDGKPRSRISAFVSTSRARGCFAKRLGCSKRAGKLVIADIRDAGVYAREIAACGMKIGPRLDEERGVGWVRLPDDRQVIAHSNA